MQRMQRTFFFANESIVKQVETYNKVESEFVGDVVKFNPIFDIVHFILIYT